MFDIVTIAGLKRLSLSELRRLEAALRERAARVPQDSAEQRRLFADLALVRREIAIRMLPRPGRP